MSILNGRVKRWAKGLGEMPGCLGHYRAGDPTCDGVRTPCSWRAACSAYKIRCRVLGVDPEQDKHLMPQDALVGLVHALLRVDPRAQQADSPKHRAAWALFLDAFEGQLSGQVVMGSVDLAHPGELYVSSVHSKTQSRPTLPMRWTIAQRGEADIHHDRPLVYFWPRPIKVVEPTIQWRTTCEVAWSQARGVRQCAARWASSHAVIGTASALRCVAIRVRPDRIAALGRLIGRCYTEGTLSA